MREDLAMFSFFKKKLSAQEAADTALKGFMRTTMSFPRQIHVSQGDNNWIVRIRCTHYQGEMQPHAFYSVIDDRTGKIETFGKMDFQPVDFPAGSDDEEWGWTVHGHQCVVENNQSPRDWYLSGWRPTRG